VLLVAAVPVAAASLLLGSAPTYDVWAWLLWGRELAHFDLNTVRGPAWKPLPVAVAALLSPAGSAAPALWLVVARAGALLAIGGAARLAWRSAGSFAAAGAALSLATVHLWLGYLIPYGMSEPLLAAFVLWAVDRHLAGRPGQAFWLLVASSLLRPEIWPFLVGYAAWLGFGNLLRPGNRRGFGVGFRPGSGIGIGRRRAAGPVGNPAAGLGPVVRRAVHPAVHPAVLLGGLLLIPAAWFVLQGLGSASPFRLGQGQAAPGGPLTQNHPGLAALKQVSADLLTWVEVGAVAGVVYAVAARDRLLLVVVAAGAGWALLVAAMAELHMGSGVSRYLVVTHACAAVLSGVGWVRFVGWARAVLGRRRVDVRVATAFPAATSLILLAVSAPVFADEITSLAHEVRYQQSLYEALPRAVDAAGGRDALLRCGRPWVDPLQVTYVAWEFRLHIAQVRALPARPASSHARRGPMLQTRNRLRDPLSPKPFRYLAWRELGRASTGGATWIVLSSCRQDAK
jgi:hypothetical protein